MRLREFIALMGASVTWPFDAHHDQDRKKVLQPHLIGDLFANRHAALSLLNVSLV